jgi:hypothetical protein
MNISFKKFSIDRPSPLLVILSWLAFNFNNIFLSQTVSIIEFSIFLFIILILEISFSNLSNRKIILFFVLNIFLFLFGYLIVLNIQNIISNLFYILVRGRNIFLPIFLFSNLILIFVKKISSFKLVNSFILVFIILNIFSNLFSYNIPKIINYTNQEKKFKTINKRKPILLLIIDEYHSPEDLFKVTKDSSIYNFSSTLKNNDWKINNSFYSHEILTERSLSSLLNYNLSNDLIFKNQKVKLDKNLFLKNLLLHDLTYKRIKIKNWGLFDIGAFKSFFIRPSIINFDYSLIGRVFTSSAIAYIWNNTNQLSINGFDKDYSVTYKYNKTVLNLINDSLPLLNDSRVFIYAHLLMPHPPFYHESPNISLTKINLRNYIKYWKFTNSLIDSILNNQSNIQNLKIIISGDHGFRNPIVNENDPRLNKNKTFLALYGFDNLNINEIKSVQDLGSLINSNF